MEENKEGLNQKQQLDQASQKTAHVAGKTAATIGGNIAGVGPAAAKLYDKASDTAVGQAIERTAGKALQHNQQANRAMRIANRMKALDALDKGIDAINGNIEEANQNEVADSLDKESKSSSKSGRFIPFKNQAKQEEGTEKEKADIEFDMQQLFSAFIKKNFPFIIIGVMVILLAMCIVVVVIGHNYSTADVFSKFLKNMWSEDSDYFSKKRVQSEKEYYEELIKIQNEVLGETGVCVDTNLITASLMMNKTNSDAIDIMDQEEDQFKKMKRYVKILARMQITTKFYSYDKTWKKQNGDPCKDTSYSVLVTESNQGDFDDSLAPWVRSDDDIDSSTIEKIAANDKYNIFTFDQKKREEERNFEYYIYYPKAEYETVTVGGVTVKKRKCNEHVPAEEHKLSIGTLNTRKDSVFYYNLLNSFIPEYYNDYLPKTEPKRSKAIETLAEEIYLLYKDFGPKQTCQIKSSYLCRTDEGGAYYGGVSQSRTEFLEKIADFAIEEMSRTGIAASVTMAQAALESGNGGSGLSMNYSNYYGMTAGTCAPSASPSTTRGTVLRPGEGGNDCKGNNYWDGTIVAMCNKAGADCQWYRIYDSFENSTRDHSRLLTSSKYGCNVYSDPVAQLQCAKDHGYATKDTYVSDVAKVMSSNNLSQYDIGVWDGYISDEEGVLYSSLLCDYTQTTVVNAAGEVETVITSSGDWSTWKQNDPAWKSVAIGKKTLGAIGCAATSTAMQIMRSGVQTTLGANFNPGTFVQEMTRVGGFSGNLINWYKVPEIAPNFKFVKRSDYGLVTPSTIATLANSGYYIILNVKNGNHWVAVDHVEGDKIYMFDPGSGGTEVGQTYGLSSIVGYTLYKVG